MLVTGALHAQEFRATISGHVLDPSGAVVANAKIEAVNVATNETTTATSDASGAYSIPLLRAGVYKVTATAAGFKQAVRDNVIVEAARALGIDIKLDVGAVTETVEVTASAVVLETQSAMRSSVVSAQHVAEMPLNARNPIMLGAMMSGVNFNGAAIWQRPFDNGAMAQWSINGGRDSSSEYMMDGAANNGQMGGNNIAYMPIVEAVQEFNVMANMYSAEYGKTGSGIMNLVLKTGTNSHHGTAFENMRRTALDANMFQNNAVGAPKTTHYLDQYGFQAEGPVIFPKLLKKDGNVKLFYMGALELYREGTPNPLQVSFPEPEMRKGDFSKLVSAAGQKVTIYDPMTAAYDASGNITKARTAFDNNTIPTARLNPIALAVTKYMPLPNRPAPPGSAYSVNNLYLPDYFDKDKFYSLILKFDWNFGNKHRAFFRHASNDRTEDRATNGIDNKPGTAGQQPFQRINDAYVVDWVTIVSPTLILNARGSYNRFIEKGYGKANEGFDLVKNFGISPALIAQLPNQDKIYFGNWSYGYTGMGRGQSNNFTDTFQLMGNVTKVAGPHTIKFGIDARQTNYEIQNTGDILSFSGSGGYTQSAYTSALANTGDSYAAFLLGIVSGSSNYPLFPWWKQYYVAQYLNDDWKVTKKLTLNLGFRLDFFSPAFEKWGRQNGPFDPNVASPIASQVAAYVATLTIPSSVKPLYDRLANLKGGLTFAKGPGVGGSPYPWLKWNPQPRVGFAYQLRPNLVLRGGFAEYMSNPNNDYYRTSGFSTSTSIQTSLDGGRMPIENVLSNPYPNGILRPTGSSLGAATFVGQNPTWFDTGFVTPSVWQFSMGFQYQPIAGMNIDASYVGSRSYNLNMNADYNNAPISVRNQCNPMVGGNTTVCNATYPNPFKGIAAFTGTSYATANTISYSQLNRPFPQFSGAVVQYGRNDSWIRYNSFQLNINYRTRSGVSVLANYTLSKQIEEWGLNDPLTNTYQQGPYTLDRPQVIKVTAIAPLPFGDGQKFGASTNRFVRRLISGWEYTTFLLDPLSGYPQPLPSNAIMLKDPRTPGGGFSGHVDWKAYTVRYWNPCVLKWYDSTAQYPQGYIAATPASVTLGCGAFDSRLGDSKFPDAYAWLQTPSNNPRYTPYRSGQIRKHHAFQLDLSLMKRTKITERMSCQIGVEAFNAFNHNYFGRTDASTNPDNNLLFGAVLPGVVGNVNNQNIQPRFLQLRFKFFW
jgi:hypothetical protein